MKVMTLNRPREPLVEEDRPVPVPGDGEVLVEVAACAVCRTDLHIADGELANPKLPLVMGHEVVGHIRAVGAGCGRLTVGERVGIPWLSRACGVCSYCRVARENLCENARFTGYTIDGGYAEYTLADESYVVRIPDGYDDAAAAPLLCAGLIGYRSLVKAGDALRIGIYGFGAAGHIVAQIAVAEGRDVYAFTRAGDSRAQALALSLGCAWVGDSTQRPPEDLDAAIIFAPVGALVPAALRSTGRGGTVICGGIHMTDIPRFPYDLLWGERQIVSVANLTRNDAVKFMSLATGIPIKTTVQLFPLSEANRALDRLRSGGLEGVAVLVPDLDRSRTSPPLPA